MLNNLKITSILSDATEQILQHLQDDGNQWEQVVDEDGNDNLPDSERQVMVFLCGDRKLLDTRPDDAAWGLNLGYYDFDKGYWRVHGRPERYVTHWRELPPFPSDAQE